MRLKLRLSIVLAVVVGLLIPAVGSFLSLNRQGKTLAAQLSSDHARLTDVLARGIESALWNISQDSASPLIESLLADLRVVKLVVRDERANTFIAAERPERRKGQQFSLQQTVLHHGAVIGDVTVEMDSRAVELEVANARALLIFTLVGQLLLSLILIVGILNVQLLAPICRLMIESDRLARRELDAPFKWKRDDELGRLGTALERTRQSLAELFGELEAKNLALRGDIERRIELEADLTVAVRSLRESEARLEAAQSLAHVGWWEFDYASGRVSLSDEARRIFGVGDIDLINWHEIRLTLIHPEDRKMVAEASEKVLRGEGRYDIEYRVVLPDGAVRLVHSQGDVQRDDSGRPLMQFGVMQDITDLWQAQQQLRLRQEMLDLAQNAARAVAFDWNIGPRENENHWSQELLAMYGLEAGTFDRGYDGWTRLVHAEDWPAVKLAMERASRSSDVDTEYRVVHASGEVRWLHAKGRMFFDAKGGPDRMVGFMIDVTDRRHAEEELRVTEARFRSFVDHATDAFFLFADDSTVVDVNQQACVSLGYSRDELMGMHPRQFDVGLDRLSLARILERIGKNEAVTFDTLHRRSDGSVFPVEIRVRQFLHRERRLYAALVRDTSERKRAEEDLRASEARFRTFVDRAADAFFLMDDTLTVIDVNRQACEGLGYARDELIGMHPRDFDVALEEASLSALAERTGAGETVTFETRHRRRDGTVFPVEVRGGAFRTGDRVVHLALARDITERKLAEDMMRQQEHALQRARTELAHVSRLTTLGELTSSIAHEVSQPLGAIIASAGACARWLAAKPPNVAEARVALDNIASDGKRARDVIGRIRALTKRQVVRKESLDINLQLEEVLALTDYESRSHRVVRQTQLDRTLPRVPGDRIQLQQVLLNLIMNAIEAMSTVSDRPRVLTLVSRHQHPNALLVEVRDTGSGIDPQHIEQIFEAFYTTKAEGIGIGLSISRSIVEAHGGRLCVGTNEPHGAVFRLALPTAEEGQP